MLIRLALGSASGLAGCIITILIDDIPQIPRWIITEVVCAASFLIGLVYVTPGGLYILDLADYFGGGFIIYVMVIAQTIAACWFYGLEQIVKDIRFMLGFGLGIYWKLTWCIFIPIALAVIFIYAMVVYEPLKTDDGEPYPPSANAAGWLVAAIAILQLPIWAAYVIHKQKGTTWFLRLKVSLLPAEEWGPKDLETKRLWLDYNKQFVRFSWIPNPKWLSNCKSR